MLTRFFDYIFYLTYKGYSKAIDNGPEMAAVVVLSCVQSFNLLSGVLIFCLISHDKSLASKFLMGVVYVIFIVANYVRYIYKENRNYKVTNEKATESNKRLKVFFAVIYLISSTVLFFGLAIYLGNKKY